MQIIRDEAKYIKKYKRHKMVCSKCGRDDLKQYDWRSNGSSQMCVMTNNPIRIECNDCGETKDYSYDEINELNRGLVEEFYEVCD